MDPEEFARLRAAVCTGDRSAAERLVRHYEPFIRRVARIRLHHSSLRRILDSLDICQSIMATFLRRAQTGAIELRTPKQLARLLEKMAIDKVRTKARKERRYEEGELREQELVDPAPSPPQLASAAEFKERIRSKLTDEEWRLFEANKLQGRSWPDIARELKEDPDALRIRLARALKRVRRELGEEGASDDE